MTAQEYHSVKALAKGNQTPLGSARVVVMTDGNTMRANDDASIAECICSIASINAATGGETGTVSRMTA